MKTSDVVIVMGSHREAGNTAYLTRNLMYQLDLLGQAYTYLDVNALNINHCIDCSVCRQDWGVCIHDDDMTHVYEILRDAKVIVWATPVYYNGITSKLKTMVDRCQMLFMCDFVHKKSFVADAIHAQKKGIIVSVGGANSYADQFVGNGLSLKLVFDNLQMSLIEHVQYSNTDRIDLSDRSEVFMDVIRIAKIIENEVNGVEG